MATTKPTPNLSDLPSPAIPGITVEEHFSIINTAFTSYIEEKEGCTNEEAVTIAAKLCAKLCASLMLQKTLEQMIATLASSDKSEVN